MFRIAKSLVKTFEQSVQDISSDRSLDVFFQSIPPQLLTPGNNTNTTLHGLRVVKVEESQLQLCSFFDYIIGINNEPIPTVVNQHGFPYPDYTKIFKTLNSFSGSSIGLNVWSGKGGFYRVEYIHLIPKSSVEDIPLNTDGNQAQTVFESLGFSAQWYPLIACTQTYHVLNINLPNGPAVVAGLIPGEDYVIGCQDGLLITGGENILQDVVRSKSNQDLVLYVYNSELDCVRPVTTHIGPEGRLGCGVGYGFIHRIPQPKLQDSQPVEDTANHNAFVPAQVAPQQQSTAPPPQLHRKKRTGHPASPSAMQDYFKEGKDQSPRYTPSGTPVPAPPQRHVEEK